MPLESAKRRVDCAAHSDRLALFVRGLLQDHVAGVESQRRAPLTPWTSAGYLQGASGPLAGIFHRLVNAGWTVWLDRGVKVALL